MPEINLDEMTRSVIVIMGSAFGLSGFFIHLKQGVSTETMQKVKELMQLSSKDRIAIIVEKMEMEKYMSIGLLVSVVGMFVQFRNILFGLLMITGGMIIIILYSMHFLAGARNKT